MARSLSTLEPGPSPEKAYDTVALREVWGVLSLALFVLSLTTRYAIRLLPADLSSWGVLGYPPILAFVSVPVVSFVGIGCALLADRKHSVTGRLGFFLNVTVCGLSLVLIALVALFFALR